MEPEAKRPRIEGPRVTLKKGRGFSSESGGVVSVGSGVGGAAGAAGAVGGRILATPREAITPRRVAPDRTGSVVAATRAGTAVSGPVAVSPTVQAQTRLSLPTPSGVPKSDPKVASKVEVKAVPKAEAGATAVKSEKKVIEKFEAKAAAVKREAPPAVPPAPGVAAKGSQVVAFDVGGTIFKVSAKLIRTKPSTLLAQLLNDAASTSEPMFVDAAPERFSYLLDWYRYGEINVPRYVPVASLLRDAEYFNLPSELIVNGVLRNTCPNVAQRVGRDLLETVTRRWAGFSNFFTRLVDDIREHFRHVGEESCGPRAGDEEDQAEAYDFPPFVIPIYGDAGWIDEQHINSAQRARALALKLEERGFVCDFTEADLIVALPLRLQGESMDGPPDGGEDDVDEGGEGTLVHGEGAEAVGVGG